MCSSVNRWVGVFMCIQMHEHVCVYRSEVSPLISGRNNSLLSLATMPLHSMRSLPDMVVHFFFFDLQNMGHRL